MPGWKLHDWIMKAMSIDWSAGTVACSLKGPKAAVELVAHGLRDLHVPRAFEWGRSVSVLTVEGPFEADQELRRLIIQMQSGDRIEIVANRFEVPEEQDWGPN